MQCVAVDVLQRIEAGDLDAFIDLVDGRVERAELDHLRADFRDEAAIGSAAGGRELGRDAGFGVNGAAQRVAECADRRQEGLAA